MKKRTNSGSHLSLKVITGVTITLCTIVAILIAAVVGCFMAMKMMDMKLYQVEGISMESTLKDNSFVLSRGDKDVQRFDIVVIENQGSVLIKRVVGMPQDILTVIDGKLILDGTPYDEIYLNEEQCEKFKKVTFQVVVPDDAYFVLGDNRDNSSDSRTLGMMKKQSIKGVVVAQAKE